MKTYEKQYFIKNSDTCALNCPFIGVDSVGVSGDETGETIHHFCEKYKTRLFPSIEGDRLMRFKDCTLIKVEWIFYFNEKNRGKNGK